MPVPSSSPVFSNAPACMTILVEVDLVKSEGLDAQQMSGWPWVVVLIGEPGFTCGTVQPLLSSRGESQISFSCRVSNLAARHDYLMPNLQPRTDGRPVLGIDAEDVIPDES